jgi:hypothetical protein
MNRIPRVLTPGASYFDRCASPNLESPQFGISTVYRGTLLCQALVCHFPLTTPRFENVSSEGTIMPTPLEVFHSSRLDDLATPSSMGSRLQTRSRQRPATAGASSLRAPTAASQAHRSTRGIQAQKRANASRCNRAVTSVQVSHSASTLHIGLDETTEKLPLQTSGSFWDLYDDTGADEKVQFIGNI